MFMLKMNNTDTRKMSCSGILIGNFEHISYIFSVSIVDFEHVFVNWGCT